MTDYKTYLPHHRDRNTDSSAGVFVDIIILIIMLALLVISDILAVVDTQEIQEQYYSKPVTFTYSRPAAYRLASPTKSKWTAYTMYCRLRR